MLFIIIIIIIILLKRQRKNLLYPAFTFAAILPNKTDMTDKLKKIARTVRRRALKSGAVVGAPRGHHRDVLRVERRGRGEGRMGVRRVRMPGVRVAGTGVRPHRRRGAARVSGERVMRVRFHSVLPGRRLLPSKDHAYFTFSSFQARAYDLSKIVIPCGRGRSREGVVLRRRGCGWDRRSGRRHVDGRLELLPVLLLLLLGLLLVVGTCPVPATSAPVEHPPRELPLWHLPKMNVSTINALPPSQFA